MAGRRSTLLSAFHSTASHPINDGQPRVTTRPVDLVAGAPRKLCWVLQHVLHITWPYATFEGCEGAWGGYIKRGLETLLDPGSISYTNMKITIACATLSVVASVAARTITVQNNCPFTVWSVHLTLACCFINSWRVVYRPAVRDGSWHFPHGRH